jgi:LacI family transcriptional regulator
LVITLEERVLGAKAACNELGIPFELVQLPSDQIEADKTIKQLIEDGFDSFLVLNNMVVLKMLSGLRNNNIELGKEVRLICFDDDEVFAFVNPPITALRQPIVEIGIHAVERLFVRLKESHQPGQHNLRKCELMIRSSH